MKTKLFAKTNIDYSISEAYTLSKEIDFPLYIMKCSGENVILHGIFHVVSCFPLHFMLYCRKNFTFRLSGSVGRFDS